MNTDTLIIIIVFACVGLVVLLFLLTKLYRSISSTSNPLPPLQPLAHHRLKSPILDEEYILLDPHPLFHSTDGSSPPSPRLIQNPRPNSIASSSRISSSHSFSLSSGRKGLPHSPHSQMNLVLPAPLSASNYPVSELGQVNLSPRPSSKHFLDVSSASSEYDRRSVSLADRWMHSPSLESYSHSNIDLSVAGHSRVPSPLIPLSPSSSSLIHTKVQDPESIPTTLSDQSPVPSHSRTDMTTSDSNPVTNPGASLENIAVANPNPPILS